MGLVVLGYFLLYEFRENVLLFIKLPVHYNILYFLALILLFAFCNPILEEWFWRIYVPKTSNQ